MEKLSAKQESMASALVNSDVVNAVEVYDLEGSICL